MSGNNTPERSAYAHHGLMRGKKVVVTAAAGTGIGGATARRSLEEGATWVLISDSHVRRLDETRSSLAAVFGDDRVFALPCDVTDQNDVDALADLGVELGGTDVVINNAGLGGSVSLLEMTDEQWHRVLDVTLTGTFRCLRAFATRMVARQTPGAIVNNASVIGWRAQREQAHYAAAKAGVMALTRSAAMDLAEHSIRVNAVAPSIAMHENLARVADPELLRHLASQEAFGRPAEPTEVANVMLFLASDLSSYMTGEVVSVSSQHP